MKKKILAVLAITLMLATTIFVCSSCGKKGTAKEETIKMNISIENQTGETVNKVMMKDTLAAMDQSWSVNDMTTGKKVAITINPVVDKGAPRVEFSFTTPGGNSYQTLIVDKGDKSIVMTANPDGGYVATVTAK